ncbi:MAG: CDP-alcohol phosphatidyltransferase family protein [Candidatus Staskawiczbacteria bacterium]|jgi:CDP-diacylglycerol--glycerol-3-phosphate 3-phosphatidyltransferase
MLQKLKNFLENIDHHRDQFLFPFILKYWPRFIVPNHLTILRIILAILIITLLLLGFTHLFWLVVIFCTAALLDLFDGSVARALDKKTQIGAVLDSLADKVLILPIAIFILAKDHIWLLVLLILPEVIAGLLVIYHQRKKKEVKVNIFGKTKMVLESFGFGIIILFDFPGAVSRLPLVLLYAGVIFAFLSSTLNIITAKNAKTV